jgi:hypothetical protein
MRTAFKYRSGSERDLLALATDQIYFPTIKQLNDPFEGIFDPSGFEKYLTDLGKPKGDIQKRISALEGLVDSIGVLSLSKSVCNELLWAHYGNQHRGIAIEYDLDLISRTAAPDSEGIEIEVNYQNSVEPLSTSHFTHLDYEVILKALLGIKSLVWSHEQEVRLLIETAKSASIPHYAVKSIYFGLRMAIVEKYKIMYLLRGRGINYFEMTTKPMQYLLEPTPMLDKYLSAPKYVPLAH